MRFEKPAITLPSGRMLVSISSTPTTIVMTNQARTDAAQRTFPVWLCYPLAFFLIVAPATDALIGLLPFKPEQMRWRVGAIGLVSGTMVFPMLGFFIALGAAHFLEHRWTRLILGGLCGLMALVLGLALIPFALDALQIRPEIASGGKPTYDIATAKGFTTLAMEAVVFSLLSFTSFRQPKPTSKRPPQPARSAAESTVPATFPGQSRG